MPWAGGACRCSKRCNDNEGDNAFFPAFHGELVQIRQTGSG
jgi:hypothetical protein